ncbi:glycosyltransferase [Scytonema sp. UIC 10036]|uniref:glycosyltransferase n=1 Tax=Scytonema sp. UIC 10036 TaxID=2304196 RepID=UPI0012DAD22D|nr:glycosyltransferase [Scytonema sp. UIC 10036]MUG96761.1 glycosyltransferase [Scytonema sp. UIC 10036]
MNIFLYLKHFPPYGDNLNEGTCKAVHGLASGLAACGARVTILCESLEDSSYQAKDGYEILSFANKNSQPSFQISTELKKYICDSAKDSLVILNGIFHRSVYSFANFLNKYSIPYILAPHDPYHPTIFQKNAHLKLPYWFLFERRILKQAKAIQVLDIRHVEWLRRLKINTPVIEVPNGFSPTDVCSESQLEWKEEGVAKLFFLGRLDAYNKGLDILLDAFAEIVKVSNCHLTIQGPDWGDKKKLQEKTARLTLSEKVSFLEPDYNSSPSSIIANYDIFCISSRFEGFSLSALEAMIAGRILLISDVAGIAPHVQASRCGIVVKPQASTIKEGCLKLLNCRSQWREMALRGRHYALEHLQWHKIAARALEQYSNLLAQ